MVRRQHIDVQVHTSADATTVYALLRDGSIWPTSTVQLPACERTPGPGLPRGRRSRIDRRRDHDPLARFLHAELARHRMVVALGDRAIRETVRAGSGRLRASEFRTNMTQITVLSMVPLRRIAPRCSARPRGESVQQPPHVRDNVRPIGPHRARIIRSKVGSQSSPDLGAGARRMT